MNKKVPQNRLISSQSSCEKPMGENIMEDDRKSTKIGHSDGDKNQAKPKRSLKLSAIRSRRADHVVVPKALDVSDLNTNASTIAKESSTTRACQYMRPPRCTNENQGYVSRATRNREQKIKKDRKKSVIGSLTSILGPDEKSGEFRPFSFANDQLDSRKTRQRPRTFISRRDRRQCAMGTFTSMVDSAVAPLTGTDDIHPSKQSIGTNVFVKEEVVPLEGAKKTFTSHRTARASRRCEKKDSKVDQSPSISVSLTSVPPKSCLRSSSRRRITGSDVVSIASSGTSSPPLELRKRRNASKGSTSISKKPEKENKQNTSEKTRTLRNGQKLNFDETKVREQIRARLRKNQQKFETHSASLAPNESKPPPSKVTSTLATPTMSVESTQALITKSYFHPIASTKALHIPKLRSRAKNGRLFSVCKKIPETIPEGSTLEFAKPEETKKVVPKEKRSSLNNKKIISNEKSLYPRSPKKAKASFYPRSPKSSPGRNKRRFRVVTPHPIECAGSSKDGHGGLCMTFPIKSSGGEDSITRIQGLMLVQ